MRRIVLYIAMSLDGYLADPAGGVDWLTGQDPSWEGDGGYSDFVRTVDTVILGRRTYDQITTQLSPSAWPYEGLSAWVLTHRDAPEPEGDIHFTDLSLDRLAARPRPGYMAVRRGGPGASGPGAGPDQRTAADHHPHPAGGGDPPVPRTEGAEAFGACLPPC